MSDIHSCSYHCLRPACVLAQRDELRDKLMEQAEPVAWVGLTDAEIYECWPWPGNPDPLTTAREIEQVLKQKNAKQAEPVAEPKVTWGVDWGRNGDENCVAIIKKLPNGDIEVVAIERNPAKQRQSDPTEGNPSF